jgi:hypothetical protein
MLTGIAATAEFRRIQALPRYVWQEDSEIPAVAEYLRSLLGTPQNSFCLPKCGHGTIQEDCPQCTHAYYRCPCRGTGIMHLKPVQAAALMAIHDHEGLVAPIRVGGGKTLISALAGSVLGVDRVILITPASLQQKTMRDLSQIRRHWKVPKKIHLLSYELLSRDRGPKELEAFRPQVIVADEAHRLKNPKAACTKRLVRYLKENTECVYVDMTGSLTDRSIMEYAHRLRLALPPSAVPVPTQYYECKDWSDALDFKPSAAGRIRAGALFYMATDEDMKQLARNPSKETEIEVARKVYGRRLLSAPGVVGTAETFDGTMSILLEGEVHEVDEPVKAAFSNLRENWELPDGYPIESPTELWRYSLQLSQGFYYRWVEPPPLDWLQARRALAAVTREILAHFHDLDSPLEARRAIEKGRFPMYEGILREWREVEGTFDPQREPHWVSRRAIDFACQWAKKNRGIIWTHEVAFARKLAEVSGLPYYGRRGLCGDRMIEDERNTCISSLKASQTGRNLQYFNNQLFMSLPLGGGAWEQTLGRMHRDGQRKDIVQGYIPFSCYEQFNILRQARNQAMLAQAVMQQYQKLCVADLNIPEAKELQRLSDAGNPMWAKNNAVFFEHSSFWSEKEERVSAMTPWERNQYRRTGDE